jgi:tight adherence protein C
VSPAALAAVAALLGAAAAWELAGALEGELARRGRRALAILSGGRARSLGQAALRLGIADRIRRAGLRKPISPAAVLGAKLGGTGIGAMVALSVAPAAPGRFAIPVGAALILAGFAAPDALLERAARRRRERLVASLPDALDLLAVGAASGRTPGTLFAEIAAGTSGPLAAELAVAVAEIECGVSQEAAIAALRDRVPGVEVRALSAALERSRRYGSPLAVQLHEQASGLRRDARRRVEERAARAAPKIQLVVALVLVPSVLLAILAAIVAHSDALLAGF